jgi:hypothetical protein
MHRHAKLTLDGDIIEDSFQFVIACVTKSTGTGMLLAGQRQVRPSLALLNRELA